MSLFNVYVIQRKNVIYFFPVFRYMKGKKDKYPHFASNSRMSPTISQMVTSVSCTMLTENFSFNEHWRTISSIIDTIFKNTYPPLLTDGIRSVEILSRNVTFHKQVLQELTQKLQKYISSEISILKVEPSIEDIVNLFRKFDKIVDMLTYLFSYWEKMVSIHITVKNLFYETVISLCYSDEIILETICSAVVNAYSAQRNQVAFVPNLSEAINISLKLKLENKLINCTIEMIKSDYQETKWSSNPSQFLLDIRSILQKEKDYLSIFPSNMSQEIIRILKKDIYTSYFDKQMGDVMKDLLSEHNYVAIQMIYHYVEEAQEPTITEIFLESICRYTIDACMAGVASDKTDSIPFYISLLKMLSDLQEAYNISCITTAIKYFRLCINNYGYRIAYLTAKYLHSKIQGQKTDFLQTFSEISFFISQLECLEYFIDVYKKFFTQRLIGYSPEIPNIEFSAMQELRSCLPSDEVDFMIEMTNDIKLSFNSFKDAPPNPNFYVRYMILNVVKWPMFPEYAGIQVTSEITEMRASFRKYYVEHNPNRYIHWVDTLETCIILYQNITIIASSLQYYVLEALYEREPLEYLNIPNDIIEDVLDSLVKWGLVLHKRSGEYVIHPFKPTGNFMRITLSSLSLPKNKVERTKEEIFNSRKGMIECAVLKAIKMKNEIYFKELYVLAQNEYSYPLEPKDLNNVLESLMAKGFVTKGFDKKYSYYRC